MAARVIDVQPTPNPNANKFVLDRQMWREPASFFDPESGRGHPVASALFAIPGVTSVLLLGDFVTVNKSPDVKWSAIVPAVKRVLQSM